MDLLPLKTEALVVEGPTGEFRLLPVIIDNIRPDEVLVEVKYSGICHSDIVAANGGYPTLQYPAVLGHEGAGIIRAVGSEVDPDLKVDTPVLCSFNHCDECRNCKAGHPACCSNFEGLNITARRMADHSTPAKLSDGRRLTSQFFACPYPEDLALYAPLGCGFQTGAGTVLNALKPSPNDSLLIFGAGTVGLAAVMGAKCMGLHQIIAVDIVSSKLELAKDLGATHVVDARDGKDVASEVRSLTQGEGVQFALECTGVSGVIESLVGCIGNGGTAVIVGCPKPDFVLKIPLTDFLHASKTVRAICQGDSISKDFVPYLMRLHREGKFPLEKLCTYYDMRNFEQAFADIRSGKVDGGRIRACQDLLLIPPRLSNPFYDGEE